MPGASSLEELCFSVLEASCVLVSSGALLFALSAVLSCVVLSDLSEAFTLLESFVPALLVSIAFHWA